MHEIAFFDETLDINSTLSYHISIQASLNGFSFCILDTVRNKYIGLKHIQITNDTTKDTIHSKSDEIIKNDELLNQNFKSVSFIYSSQKSTLVPSSLFIKENLKSFFCFNHTIDVNDIIYFNKLKNADAYNIFAIPKYLVSSFSKKFPNIKFHHQATPFIENILIKNKHSGNKKTVFINVQKWFFDIVVINSKNLSLYNSFHFKNEKDFIFFIMYIYEKINLNPEENEIIFSGEIDNNSKYFEIVKKFIRHIKFEKLNDSFSYSYTFNDISPHTFVNLINLYRCE